MTARELNLDGLVGPTHNYAGLSPGNLASAGSSGRRSHPRAAALQGLDKMARLHALGVPQAILPPQPRPALEWLRALGFGGRDVEIPAAAAREAPRLLAAAYSASSMWAANAATVLPSPDTADGRVHFVPANLSNERHRALETPFTARLLRAVFSDPLHFAHHEPLPLAGDEGAANHTRLCPEYGSPGLELFVHGPGAETSGPTRHPARQHADASRAVARLGRLAPGRTRFFGQLPEAIDAGVFHNDVIATGDRSLLFLHQDAFVDQAARLDELRATFARELQGELRVVEVERDAVPLAAAVSTYLFNCQVVRRPDGRCAWIGPLECLEEPSTAALLEALSGSGGPFDEIHFVDLRESMRNGGGPACLRLRVVLTEAEERARHHGIDYDAERDQRLRAIVERHYREHLDPADLADPALMDEARRALDAITDVLGLGSVYDFQRA